MERVHARKAIGDGTWVSIYHELRKHMPIDLKLYTTADLLSSDQICRFRCQPMTLYLQLTNEGACATLEHWTNNVDLGSTV